MELSDGIVNGDIISINQSGIMASFMNDLKQADKNSGNNFKVPATGYALSGEKANNYTIYSPTNLTANI